MNPQKVIDAAIADVGYLEKSKSAYIKIPAVIWYKLDGAGYDNITKFAYEIDRIDWYSAYVQYQPWCATAVDYWFLKAFDWDIEKASECKNHGATDCLVDDAIVQYQKIGRWFHDPMPGDQVFFSKANGIDPAHTGLVVAVDDTYVHTIEGNTSSQEGVDPAGGGVFRKKYRKDYYRLLGFGRPLYEEDEDMDISKLIDIIKDASPEERKALGEQLDGSVRSYRLSLTFPATMQGELDAAKALGITDGSRPMDYCTRGEAAIMDKREFERCIGREDGE